MTFAIIATRLLVVLLALLGILANLAISSDVKRNRRGARLLREVEELDEATLADLEETARIDVRGARASAGAHAMFLVLGVVEMGVPVPPGGSIHLFGAEMSRQVLALGFAILWDAIQALVVVAQVRNQLARMRYRRRSPDVRTSLNDSARSAPDA